MRKRQRAQVVERLILAFVRSLRRFPRRTLLNPVYRYAYYWNEREYQWALLCFMKDRALGWGLGGPWSVHAEADVARPRYARWDGGRRCDIGVVDHEEELRNCRLKRDGKRSPWSAYESLIEIKVVPEDPGYYREAIQRDIQKLNQLIRDNQTWSGYVLLLDSTRREDGRPCFSPLELQAMRAGGRVGLIHWPDGAHPVHDASTSKIQTYWL